MHLIINNYNLYLFKSIIILHVGIYTVAASDQSCISFFTTRLFTIAYDPCISAYLLIWLSNILFKTPSMISDAILLTNTHSPCYICVVCDT